MNALKPFQNQKGFTMVELVIVIVLIGAIAMTASLLIGQAAQTYQKEDNYSTIANQGRLALEEMAREIRMIRSPSDITSCLSSNLSFTDVNGNLVAYNFSGTSLSVNANILADNLTVFSISYLNKTGGMALTCSSIWTITVNLTPSQGGDSLPMRTTLHPRSF